MKTSLLFLLLLLIICNLFAQKEQVTVYTTLSEPVLDGIEEQVWSNTEAVPINKDFGEEHPSLTAYWKMLWDENNIYVMVHVEDDDHWPSWEIGVTNWWEWDNVELYFDLNRVLEDGNGSGSGSGHWQSAPTFQEDKYGSQFFDEGSYGSQVESYCAYTLHGEGYVWEWKIPMENLWDENNEVLNAENIMNRDIGFDVTVVDQDEGITTARQRKVWQSDGTIDECWNNMDGAGIIRFEYTHANEDSVLCDPDQQLTFLIEAPIDDIVSYTWDLDGGQLLSSNENMCNAKWETPGIKHVILTVQNSDSEVFNFTKDITIYSKMTVLIGEDLTSCKNSEINISADIENGVEPYTYYWNNIPGTINFSGNVQENAYLFVKVIDNVGCEANNSIYVSVPSQIDADPIYKVSVESASNKIIIEWDKTPSELIKEYSIQRESDVANQYETIGTVTYNEESIFIDEDSEPTKYADKYVLLTTDICDNVSEKSDAHQNIHLQISPGLPGLYNLIWSPYIGFNYSTYNIYKGTSAENMVLIDQISSSKTQYTDTSSFNVYYQIGVQRNSNNNSSNLKSVTNTNEARSNIEFAEKTSLKTLNKNLIRAYPNPTNGLVIIDIEITGDQIFSVIDYTGKTLMSEKFLTQNIDLKSLKKGVYFILIQDSGDKGTTHSFQIEKK